MIQTLAQRVVLLWGWQRLAVAALAGLIAALALPPVDFLPAMAVSLTLAVWLIDGSASGPGRFSIRTLTSAFTVGWAFGFGYFLGGFWWLGAAFLVEDDQFAWLMPFGVLGFPAAMALFHAFGFLLARLLWSDGGRRIFAFVTAMTLVEWLRGVIFTGFPWNSIGQALASTDATAQIASIIGLNGLTILALFMGAAPAVIGTGETHWRRIFLPLCAALTLIGIAVFGFWRLQTTAIATVPDVRVRIMQPNLSQREKHRLSAQEVLTRYLQLSDRAAGPGAAGISDVTHLVWPESPFPFLLAREPKALSQIAMALKPRTVLITGAARAEDASGETRYFNAIHVVGPDGIIADSYDKVHLVPFGEYLPFRALFDWLKIRQFVEIPGGFDAGARRKPLQVRGLPVTAPLICYEAIFPGEPLTGGTRAGLLLNVTNDGWFGHTAGPYQHLAQARLRSVEQGIPQIRAANTGTSAIIDPLGRVILSLPLGHSGVIDGAIAKALAPTFFTGFGNLTALLLLAISFFICIRVKSL